MCHRLSHALAVLLCFTVSFCLASCSGDKGKQKERVFDVSVLKLSPVSVPLSAEYPGRVSALQKAEVRPQVSGILQKRLFVEGGFVKEGQPLYKIDPAIYIANHESAKASLASAKAKYSAASLRKARRARLLETKAVSQQAFEDADSECRQAQAMVRVCEAAVRNTAIRLRYTDVLAPISGKIGKSSVTQGALLTENQPAPLAVIQQVDHVYVDTTQPSKSLLKMAERYANGSVTRPDDGVKAKLYLETGKEYPYEGELKFSDISVEESTGMVLLRAVFENPDVTLLPGMYVRVKVNLGVAQNVLLVPQLAVARDARGAASVFVIKNGVAEKRVVTADERSTGFWVISDGLQEGETVAIEGYQHLRPDAKVKVRKTFSVAELFEQNEAKKKEASEPRR